MRNPTQSSTEHGHTKTVLLRSSALTQFSKHLPRIIAQKGWNQLSNRTNEAANSYSIQLNPSLAHPVQLPPLKTGPLILNANVPLASTTFPGRIVNDAVARHLGKRNPRRRIQFVNIQDTPETAQTLDEAKEIVKYIDDVPMPEQDMEQETSEPAEQATGPRAQKSPLYDYIDSIRPLSRKKTPKKTPPAEEFSDLNTLLSMLSETGPTRRNSSVSPSRNSVANEFQETQKAISEAIQPLAETETQHEEAFNLDDLEPDVDDEDVQPETQLPQEPVDSVSVESSADDLRFYPYKVSGFNIHREEKHFGYDVDAIEKKFHLADYDVSEPVEPIVKSSIVNTSRVVTRQATRQLHKIHNNREWKYLAQRIRERNEQLKEQLEEEGTISARFQELNRKQSQNIPLGINMSDFGLLRQHFTSAPASRAASARIYDKNRRKRQKSPKKTVRFLPRKTRALSLKQQCCPEQDDLPPSVKYSSRALHFAVVDVPFVQTHENPIHHSEAAKKQMARKHYKPQSTVQATKPKTPKKKKKVVVMQPVVEHDATEILQETPTLDAQNTDSAESIEPSATPLDIPEQLGVTQVVESTEEPITQPRQEEGESIQHLISLSDDEEEEVESPTETNQETSMLSKTAGSPINGWDEDEAEPTDQLEQIATHESLEPSIPTLPKKKKLKEKPVQRPPTQQRSTRSRQSTSDKKAQKFPSLLNQVLNTHPMHILVPRSLPIHIQAAIKYSLIVQQAITQIQRIMRGCLQKRRYKRIQSSVLAIQRTYRLYCMRKFLKKEKHLAVDKEKKTQVIQHLDTLSQHIQATLTPRCIPWKSYVHKTSSPLPLPENALRLGRLQMWTDFADLFPGVVAQCCKPRTKTVTETTEFVLGQDESIATFHTLSSMELQSPMRIRRSTFFNTSRKSSASPSKSPETTSFTPHSRKTTSPDTMSDTPLIPQKLNIDWLIDTIRQVAANGQATVSN